MVLLWYEKKLMVAVGMWYTTMMCFIYIASSEIWFGTLCVDLIGYYLLFGNYDEVDPDEAADEDELGEKYDHSSLDPFGARIIANLLYGIIVDRLVTKRDEKLIAMM